MKKTLIAGLAILGGSAIIATSHPNKILNITGVHVSSPNVLVGGGGTVVKVIQKPPGGTRAVVIENGVVINAVLVPLGWPGSPNAWQPPVGTTAILSDDAAIGDTYDGKDFFHNTNPVKIKPTPQELLNKDSYTEEELQILVKYLLQKP